MSLRRFLVLLRGLSGDALYREATRKSGRAVTTDQAAMAAISRM